MIREAWRVLDIGTIVGLIAAIAFFIMALLLAASFHMETVLTVFDLASLLIVLGGTVSSTLIAVSFRRFSTSMKASRVVFNPPTLDPAGAINQIVALANTARKEGVLALEDSAANMEDQFLQKGIMLIVDGTDPELVKGIMETELAYIEERHGDSTNTFELMNGLFPAWGMIGTVVGIIMMLADLGDMDALAASMSLALITTLYGVLFANIWALPFSNKLRQISKEEVLLKTVLIEGMLSIQAGENPRIIEEKLKSFLSPALRDNVGDLDRRSLEAEA